MLKKKNIDVTATGIMQKLLGEHNRRDFKVIKESKRILGVLNKVVCRGTH